MSKARSKETAKEEGAIDGMMSFFSMILELAVKEVKRSACSSGLKKKSKSSARL